MAVLSSARYRSWPTVCAEHCWMEGSVHRHKQQLTLSVLAACMRDLMESCPQSDERQDERQRGTEP